jgi:hypothetical protein
MADLVNIFIRNGEELLLRNKREYLLIDSIVHDISDLFRILVLVLEELSSSIRSE